MNPLRWLASLVPGTQASWDRRGQVALAREAAIRARARALCVQNGRDPDEIVPVGPCVRMMGGQLVDGEEVPRWHLYADLARRIGDDPDLFRAAAVRDRPRKPVMPPKPKGSP